ncbi:MAG: cation:proton antiporter [Verrucomicrobiaceae bacterium]|nr:MAG: cation:proton antiporter [Verrucomicrobiaceae bacterium]
MLEGVSLLTGFALVMLLALLLPRLMERLRLPSILGYIVAGFLLGPAVLGVMNPDGKVITLFAELGKLLFMFFVGFEIDLEDFKKSRNRALCFGTLTFAWPFAAGVALAISLGHGLNAALLTGSIIASHTLLAFPILQKLGLSRHPVVLMVVGGTIFTDIASMLVLAITVSVHETGFSWRFLGIELLELAVFVPLILFGAGALARKALIRYGQKPEMRVIVMLVVIALCAEGARLIQLEGIVGAFLAGIAAKRALRGKFAVEQLEVVAHSLFIPAFFLTTGFLVDLAVLQRSLLENPLMSGGLLVGILGGKTLAAWLTARIYHFDRAEMWTMASLSYPQMAATLASAVVGYQTVNAAGERLLDAGFVNAVVVVIIVTCVLGPILTARHAPRMKSSSPPDNDLSPDPTTRPVPS